MHLNPERVGYSSNFNFILSLVVFLVCSLYQLCLLYVVYKYIWNEKEMAVPSIMRAMSRFIQRDTPRFVVDIDSNSALANSPSLPIVQTPMGSGIINMETLKTNNNSTMDGNSNRELSSSDTAVIVVNQRVNPNQDQCQQDQDQEQEQRHNQHHNQQHDNCHCSATSSPPSMSSLPPLLKHKKLDIRIKWIVVLFIIACWCYCVGVMVELSIYGFDLQPSRLCSQGMYSYYIRIFTNTFFFLFYSVRLHVMLYDTLYALSTCAQVLFAMVPILSFVVCCVSYELNLQLHNCETNTFEFRFLGFSTIFVEMICNISLFAMFSWKLYQLIKDEGLASGPLIKDLKQYLNKLFRLFLVTEIISFIFYAIVLIPELFEFARIAVAVELCVVGTTMIFSFKYSQSLYNCLCLCTQ